MIRPGFHFLALLPVCILVIGCDSVHPGEEGTLVVEAYFDAGRPLPPIRVGRTVPLSQAISEAEFTVTDAVVELTMDGSDIRYRSLEGQPGTYVPEDEMGLFTVPPGSGFSLRVTSGDRTVLGSGTIPPRIRLEDVFVDIPDRAVEAVFVDTLNIGLDSLNLGLDARQGYIYPIQVSMEWIPEEGPSPRVHWIETRLDPVTTFSSSIVDFFLLPHQIVPEESTSRLPDGRRRSTGVYAIPVDAATAPVPRHDLRITLLRADEAFARFTTSSDSPNRREPQSNLDGALGFVGGVSTDSIRIQIGGPDGSPGVVHK